MISQPELQAALRIGSTEAASDYVAGLESAAVAHAERATNRSFALAGERTLYVEGLGTRDLWLPEAPSAEEPVTVVERAAVGDTGTSISSGDSNGFVARGSRLIRKGGQVWARGYEYEVTCTAGYAPGEEPPDIRKAVLDLVVLWYERRLPLPKVGENLAFPVPHHVDRILRAWRRPPAGAV